MSCAYEKFDLRSHSTTVRKEGSREQVGFPYKEENNWGS